MNKVEISGNLTRDPEFTQHGGTTIATFSIAETDFKQYTSYIDVKCFNDVAKSLTYKKGDLILVTGYIRQERWKTGEGENRSKQWIIAKNIELKYYAKGNKPEQGSASVGNQGVQPNLPIKASE